jgi:hypothetical protein
MAVVPRPLRAPVHAAASDSSTPESTPPEILPVPTPEVYASTDLRERLGNLLPLFGSLGMASMVFLAPWHPTTAFAYAVFIVAFYSYWVFRSYGVAVACMVGLRRINRWLATDWHAKYLDWAAKHPDAEAWEWPRHLIVIPNYKEAESELHRTIGSLAAQPNAKQLVVVLAMEAREPGAEGKAARLLLSYRDTFADIFASHHPAGLPGETPGKGSNEAWGLREAYRRLIADGGDDLRRYTVTSCDADAVFSAHHFTVLNHLFLSEPDRYRTFWQPTIFNSNNIWDVPAGPRMLDGLSGVNRLANLTLPGSVKFPTSCYSLSWQMLHEVGYWDEEVIPEDWHLYLKCCFSLGDRVHVVPMYVRLGNDCVLTDSTWHTLRAHYFQSVRHAWGASDIPYAWRATWRRGPLSWPRKLLLAFTVSKVHVLWMSQWYLVTIGVLVPSNFAKIFGAPMPVWWTERRYEWPGLTWHLDLLFSPSQWFEGAGLIEPVMRLNLPGALVAICVLPLFVLIVTEYRQRGARPSHVSAFTAIRSFAMWPLMAPSTFFFASMPSLHAQLRLGSGAGLVYRVAEKGSREEVHVRAEADEALGGLEQSLPAEVSHDRRRVEPVAAERAG